MTRPRRMLLLAVALVGLVTATGGYTAVQGDRTVGVRVVDDDAAYVGVEGLSPTVDGEERVELLRVDNRFGTAVDVRVTVGDAAPLAVERVGFVGGSNTAAADGSVTATATVDCDGAEAGQTVAVSATVRVETDDGGVAARVRRVVGVRCSAATATETATATPTATATDPTSTATEG